MAKLRTILSGLSGNWTKIPNELFRAGISVYALATYVYIASVREEEHPSERQLTRALNISRKSVAKALVTLHERNMIARHFVPLKNGRRSGRYTFVAPEFWRVNREKTEGDGALGGQPASAVATEGAMDGHPQEPKMASQGSRLSREEMKMTLEGVLSLPHAPQNEKEATRPQVAATSRDSPLCVQILQRLREIEEPVRHDDSARAFGRVVFGDVFGRGALIEISEAVGSTRDLIDQALLRWRDRGAAFFQSTSWTKEGWERAHIRALDDFVRERKERLERANQQSTGATAPDLTDVGEDFQAELEQALRGR